MSKLDDIFNKGNIRCRLHSEYMGGREIYVRHEVKQDIKDLMLELVDNNTGKLIGECNPDSLREDIENL